MNIKCIGAAVLSAVSLLTGCSGTKEPTIHIAGVPAADTSGAANTSQVSTDDDGSSVKDTPAQTAEKSRIVLVGDSRTMHIGNYLYELPMIDNKYVDGETPDGDYIMGLGGEGYGWLSKNTSEVEKRLTDGCILVVNMGVNGAPYYHKEIAEWCNNMAVKNKDRSIRVYFMSVNPVNDRLLEEYNYSIRNADVIAFNSAVRTELTDAAYIDTYSVVEDDILGNGKGTPDGLHYYEYVYRKIRDYTWEVIYE